MSTYNIRVLIQPSSNRCYSDTQYEKVGAVLSEDLSSCDVICGIKPAQIDSLLPYKTYLMYSRIASGAAVIAPYLKKAIENKITIIDYERIRDDKDQMLVGSSRLAGAIGMFNTFRIIGEYLLLRRNMNTPFLYTGGSAYMHQDKQSCFSALQKIASIIDDQGGLPRDISPFIIGISGRGVVSEGAIELLRDNLPSEELTLDQVKEIVKNPTPDSNKKIYYTLLSREHYLKKKEDHQLKFNASDFEQSPDDYESVLHTDILPYLTVLVNCNNWKKGSTLFLTVDQMKQLSQASTQENHVKLLAISDISALVEGPIEFFTEDCKIENPYFLFDMDSGKRYETYKSLSGDSNASQKRIIVYQGVEQLPAELPKDASQMFSDKLETYIYPILQAQSTFSQQEGAGFEQVWEESQVSEEIKRAIITTGEGKTGKLYGYLNSLM